MPLTRKTIRYYVQKRYNELFAYERKKRNWTQGNVADKINAPDERLIRRWERGEVSPTPHYRGKLAEVFGKSARALGFPPDGQISFWHMAYRRDAFFTGRDDILQLLRDTLLAQHVCPVPRLPLALSGLGGVGKSHIALEYAYRYREHYHTVLWLHATSYQDLVSGVTAIADLLDLPGQDAANPEQLIEALKEWLTQLTHWLLIFDNVENWQLLEGFLPAEIKGHLLLTTRSQNTGTYAHHIAVEPMDNNTGAELLLRRAKLIALESTLEHVTAADAATVRSLSEDMGGLPLALDQAGAYIEEKDLSLSEYVQRYHTERRKLLHMRGARVSERSEHPEPVAVTLGLNVNSAAEQHPLATDILNFCAFLAPEAIPEELFQYDKSLTHGTTVFDEAIAALLRYSLIRSNTEEQTFSIHRLVQAVLIDDMPHNLQKQWKERVMRALNSSFPVADFRNWIQCERLLPHAMLCETWMEDDLIGPGSAAELFHRTGDYLSEKGQYSVAERLFARVLLIFEQYLGFGADHPATAHVLSDLARLYLNQGKYDQAELLYQQALAILANSGTENYSIAIHLCHLADLYLMQGNYSQAEPLLKRALSFLVNQMGPKHPDTIRCLFTLSVLYFMQGKDDQAELLYQRSIRLWEKQLETDDFDIDIFDLPLQSLAVLAHHQGKYELVKALFQRIVSIIRRLGATHPHIRDSQKAYADFLLSIDTEDNMEAPVLEINEKPSV